ncbi:MAG: metal ABC transporter substrate-binding protein, partial [Clostridia bacterium]|nr:metal ABC transporter substrate-binding protein [Clostridia bacterium]
LITLSPDADFTATVLDIVDNPLNLDIQEIEAAQVPRTLQDVDIAVINGNYAIDAGLDAGLILATEDPNSEAAQTYANILVVKEGNEDNEQIQALAEALQSEEVRTFIEETYGVAVVPIF